MAAGLDAGETTEQLRNRLLAVFGRDGAQLGESRAERIARTEATRAWNAATLAAALAMGGPERPLVKQWLSRRDTAVRHAHRAAHGQTRPVNEPFTVGGHALDYPGDPTAPPDLTVQCRCVLTVAAADRSAAAVGGPTGEEHTVPTDPVTAAADRGHTKGAMIALVPSEGDAARLALAGGEPADELHLTLYYLGDDGTAYSSDEQAAIIAAVADTAAERLPTPVAARLFGAAHWNASSDAPAWVWSAGDDTSGGGPRLADAHAAAVDALAATGIAPERLPAQYTPWAAHVCAAYTHSPTPLADLNARLGPVVFDRLRVAFAGEYTDIPLGPQPAPDTAPAQDDPAVAEPRPWHTPGQTAIAFENQETGDGRIFAPGSLYWSGPGPWPLQYAEEMLSGHEGAELAGSIQSLGRDGDRIIATGVLYPSQPAGADAITLLEEGAPLGVSVDLDDVDVEFVDRRGGSDMLVLAASLPAASLIRLQDGTWMVRATTTAEWTASGNALMRTGSTLDLITDTDGRLSAAGVTAALTQAGVTITAAAGDPDRPDAGTVVQTQSSGDVLMRITRGRVRGATLVAMPAYDQARIVLTDTDQSPASAPPAETVRAAAGTLLQRVITYVASAPSPVRARQVAHALGITMESARAQLARAATAERIVRIARGLYVGRSHIPEGTEVAAALSGDLGLPIHPDRDAEWDGDAAASRVLEWATTDGEVDADRLGTAFLYRDPGADPATLAAYKLGMADVYEGELRIVPRGVFAVASVLQGGRGGVDIPPGELDEIRDRVEDLYERLADALDDPSLRAPWDSDDQDDDGMRELEASAWTAMRELPPMPAAWFREPTMEELPPGSGGVHSSGGRIYGWVAQAGEPHAGYPGKNLTIESLGDLDLSHFLRAQFRLDDGTVVRAGAFTMNAPHHRDGAECESAVCQFDDTRTVAGIVTVGLNERGLWFSGAAAPWLSEWDRTVFQGCQPSYHMKRGRDGRWQLRAVLSVPVPGHSSPLVAATVERSNLALVASASATTPTAPATDTDTAAVVQTLRQPLPEPVPQHDHATDPDGPAGDLAAALTQPAVVDALLDAMERRRAEREAAARAEVARLAAQLAPVRDEIAASATQRGH